jgi:photosystem II stability/assembly factor-like uncharacterized protein
MSNLETPSPTLTATSTILGLGLDDGGCLWVGAKEGIFYRADNTWKPAPSGQPLNYLNAFACAGQTLLAGSGSGLIVFSHDGGKTWTQGYVADVKDAVTALALSPNFTRDQTAFASTQGAGVLRSFDGGRTWHSANRGLYGLEVTALATAPTWAKGMFVLAGTAHDLYYSPNGGTAWNSSDSGLTDVVVTAIAFSPNFLADGVVLLGTEAHGLYRSTNRGRAWQHLSNVTADAMVSINTLWQQGAVYLLGTDGGEIFRSVDGGATWPLTHTAHAPLMCFGADTKRIYAGLYEGGLLGSDDGGWTWWRME